MLNKSLLLVVGLFLFAAEAKAVEPTSPKTDMLAKILAADLVQACPLGDPADQESFDQCRAALFDAPLLAQAFTADILWGGQDASKPFYQQKMTHFSRQIFTGLYLPLFMFSGKYEITRNKSDNYPEIRLEVRFRNRLMPGAFPYPFWHEEHKWNAYEEANELILRIDPVTIKILAAMRSKKPGTQTSDHVAPVPFDGKWLWTDQAGKTQPAVTLFDGLYSKDNPFKPALDTGYRSLALLLRDGTCTSCHVPNNPSKMIPLILMQTPAHAAGEINNIIRSIEKNEMPLTDFGAFKPLDPMAKENLLREAQAFKEIVEQAEKWETLHR